MDLPGEGGSCGKSLNMLIEDREVSVSLCHGHCFCLVLLESLVYLAWFSDVPRKFLGSIEALTDSIWF